MTKLLPSEELNRIVLAIENFSKTDMTASEANTKKKIVEPLLDMLDWDTRSNEVILEYPIRIGSTSKHVDYALILEDEPVILVEAKAFDAILSEEECSQIISYGRIEDVQWAVLTNGKTLKVFDTKEGKSEKECLVIEVGLKDLPMKANDLDLISRESILTGQIEETAKRLAATRNAIHSLKNSQEKIAEEFKKDLLLITGTEVENRVGNISKQLAKQVIELFEKHAETSREELPKKIELVAREELSAKPEGEVVLCLSRIEGVEFLKKYNAWGFVNMARKDIPYFALYVGKPESSVLYFGEIESITQPLKSKEDLVNIKEKDTETFETGKRVIHLKPGTLSKFKDPIPLKNRKGAPRGLRYTTLRRLIHVNSVSEL